MTRARFPDGPPFKGGLDVLKLLVEFDQAWQNGTPPRIEDFLQAAQRAEQTNSGPDQRQLLERLIQIDLEYRWRSTVSGSVLAAGSLPERPHLEDYLKCYPQLGAPESLSLELIGEEYWVRQLWGDRPSHSTEGAGFEAKPPSPSRLPRTPEHTNT